MPLCGEPFVSLLSAPRNWQIHPFLDVTQFFQVVLMGMVSDEPQPSTASLWPSVHSGVRMQRVPLAKSSDAPQRAGALVTGVKRSKQRIKCDQLISSRAGLCSRLNVRVLQNSYGEALISDVVVFAVGDFRRQLGLG